jgi:hypothetical protein
MQSSKDGMTTEAKSSLAPSKSLSHKIWYLTVPRVGVTMVLLPLGQADITVGLVDDALAVFELSGGVDDVELELLVGVALDAVVVIKTVTIPTGCDDDVATSGVALESARCQISRLFYSSEQGNTYLCPYSHELY